MSLISLRRLVGFLCAVALLVSAARPAFCGDRKSARAAREIDRLRSDGEAALARKDFAAARQAYSELYRRTLQPDGLYRLMRRTSCGAS
jgi:hypothetical protein